MMRVLLDTDILSEILKGKNRTVARRSSVYEFEHGAFTTSAVSVGEIVAGLSKRGNAGVLAFVGWYERHEVLVLDRDAGQFGGEIYAKLRALGSNIGLPDCFDRGHRTGERPDTRHRQHEALSADRRARLPATIGELA